MYPVNAPPTLWGMARHGLVVDDTLSDCAALEVAYEQPTSPDFWKVQHSRAKLLVYTQEDYDAAVAAGTPCVFLSEDQVAEYAADGVEFTDFDLISGRNCVLAGYELGEQRWIYCDANRAWIVEYLWEPPDTDPGELQVWLRGMFGGIEGLELFDLKIGAMTVCADPGCDFEYSALYDVLNHSVALTGDRAVICDRYFSTTASVDPDYEFFYLQYVCNGPREYDAIEANRLNTGKSSSFSASWIVTLSGDGSIEAGSYGSGISAGIAVGYAEYGYGGENLYDATKGYVAAHWTNEDGDDTTVWAKMTYVADDPNPGDFYYTGRVITLPDETTIVDDDWILTPADGDWEATLHWNGDSVADDPLGAAGTCISGSDYLGYGRDILLIVRPGNQLLAVHRSGATYGPVDMIDTTYGTDFFVYDPVHDEWSQHTGTDPVGVA